MHTELINRLKHAVEFDLYEDQISLCALLGDSFYTESKQENFKNWEPIVYSSVLYNYALVLSQSKQIAPPIHSLQKKIYQLKKECLTSFPMNYEEDLLRINQRKNALHAIRQQVKIRYQSEQQPIDEIYLFMEQALDNFYIELFEYSMNVIDPDFLKKDGKTGLCIVKLCSGAIQRMHLYSDLDFLVLCDQEKNNDFISKFSLLTHLLILELGETPLRMVAIPGLDFIYTYYKYPANGIKFDGRKSGAYPLKSRDICPVHPFALVGSPTEMVDTVIQHMECTVAEKHVLSEKMLTTKYLWGNETLLQSYHQLLTTKLEEKNLQTGLTLAQKTGLLLFARDLNKTIFYLKDFYVFKQELRRFEYVITSMGLYFHCFNKSPETIVSWLIEHQKITPEEGQLLVKQFAWFKKIRLEMDLMNRSDNQDLPVLWHYSAIEKYSGKSPALIYFLDDIYGLARLYQLVSNIGKMTSQALYAQKNLLHLELQHPAPVIEILNYVSTQIQRNNSDIRCFHTHEHYNNFPETFFYPQSIQNYFSSRPLNQKAFFLEKSLYVGLCIANHYLLKGSHQATYTLLVKLIELFNGVIPEQLHTQYTALCQKPDLLKQNSQYLLPSLIKFNANLPTLLAVLHYLFGRCYFYSSHEYNFEQAHRHLHLAHALREIIDKTPAIDDHYNEAEMDTLIIKRSGLLRLQSIKADLPQLKEIKKLYESLRNENQDLLNSIECNCSIIRLETELHLLTGDSAFHESALQHLNQTWKMISLHKVYTFFTKVSNLEARLHLQTRNMDHAKRALSRPSPYIQQGTFFNPPRIEQHLKEQFVLEQKICLL